MQDVGQRFSAATPLAPVGQFLRYLKGKSRSIVPLIVAFTAFCVGLFIYMYTQFGVPFGRLTYVILFPALFAALVLFLHYGKFIENRVFKRRIDAKKLRVGDVPIGSKWKVLDENEVRALKLVTGKPS